MKPEDIPATYKALIDDAAGIDHSNSGAVMTVLAAILTVERGEDVTPSFKLVASDPAAPFALLAYASALKNRGGTSEDVNRIRALAQDFYEWQDTHGIIPPGKSTAINANVARMVRHLDE